MVCASLNSVWIWMTCVKRNVEKNGTGIWPLSLDTEENVTPQQFHFAGKSTVWTSAIGQFPQCLFDKRKRPPNRPSRSSVTVSIHARGNGCVLICCAETTQRVLDCIIWPHMRIWGQSGLRDAQGMSSWLQAVALLAERLLCTCRQSDGGCSRCCEPQQDCGGPFNIL